MSQASSTIAPAAASDKADTAMGRAIADATSKKAVRTKNNTTGTRKTSGNTPAQASARRVVSSDQRDPITLADAEAVCPHQQLASNLARTFGLEPVDMTMVRADTDRSIRDGAASLAQTLNERALAMHLQRVVGAYVGSAYGSGNFYSAKVTQARDATSRLANEDRDEDRDGVSGFDSKAARAREFAATMGIQAATLLAAAMGAADAYEHLTGETWKPYDTRRPDNTRTVSRRAAVEEMNVFG